MVSVPQPDGTAPPYFYFSFTLRVLDGRKYGDASTLTRGELIEADMAELAELEAHDLALKVGSPLMSEERDTIVAYHGLVFRHWRLRSGGGQIESLPVGGMLLRGPSGQIEQGFVSVLGLMQETQRTSALAAQMQKATADAAAMPTQVPTPPVAANPSKTRAGVVYLLEGGGFFKIGRARSIKQRSYMIGTQMPFPVTVRHTIETEDCCALERQWHKRFADKRSNGEWFALTDQDVAEFCSH